MLNYAKAFLMYPAAERYLKRDIGSKLTILRDEHSKPASLRRKTQLAHLHRILKSAELHVPYYRDLFQSVNFTADEVLTSLDSIRKIPILTKDTLREQGERMLNEEFRQPGMPHLQVRTTNGSTGLVTPVWYNQESLDWTAAVNRFVSEWPGRTLTKTEVHLSTQFKGRMRTKDAWIEQVKCWSLNRINVYTNSFDSAGLDRVLNDLKNAKAFSVQGHPSTLYFLAMRAKESGFKGVGLFKVFEATGETIEPAKAKVISDTFGCIVCNRYGSAEFGVVAHSHENVSELEILDSIVFAESMSFSDGQEELVMSGLRNPVMPLIRYRTGDLGEVFDRSGLQMIRNLRGRVHDSVKLNGTTYPTHFVKDVLERIGGFDEFQIVFNAASTQHQLKIVPNAGFNLEQMTAAISEYFGNSLKIDVTTFDGLILQGQRDKFRYLVNLKTDQN